MKKQKLLYIGNKTSKRGTVTTMETLVSLFESEKITVYSASSVQNKVLRLLHMLWSLVIKARKVDVILIDTYSTQNFYYAVAVAKLSQLLSTPYVPILHGGNLPFRLQNNPNLSQKLFGRAKVNVAPSRYLFEAFQKNGFNNLAYIPNTIKIDNYPFKLRKKIAPKLLWVRSFAEIYNPKLALAVVEKLIEKGYHASLCMVGPEKDGSLAECKKIAEQRKLPVTFTGKLEKGEWISLSQKYDIFINTTQVDNTPVSVIEAMALGLPVISTRVGGIPYLLKNEIDSLLVPPNDSGVFVNAISALMKDENLLIEISQNARAKAECFDWQIVKNEWFAIFKTCKA